jgi:hypothetical protein
MAEIAGVQDQAMMREGALAQRFLPDGRELVVYRLTFGRARLSVGPAGAAWLDDGW